MIFWPVPVVGSDTGRGVPDPDRCNSFFVSCSSSFSSSTMRVAACGSANAKGAS